MNDLEIIITVRQHELDGSYSEWTTKPGLLVFTAKARKEIEKLGGKREPR